MEEPGDAETERYGMVIPTIVKPKPQPVAVSAVDITHNRYINEEEHTGLQVAQVKLFVKDLLAFEMLCDIPNVTSQFHIASTIFYCERFRSTLGSGWTIRFLREKAMTHIVDINSMKKMKVPL